MKNRSEDVQAGQIVSGNGVGWRATARPLVSDTLYLGVGLLFVAAGLLKFFLPSQGAGLHGGTRGFGQMLASLHVPLPLVFASLVPATEVLGGLGLMTRRYRRLWAVPLIIDMIIAIALVGLPGALGRTVLIGSAAIGNEPWRLPLEAALLVALLWLWRPQSKE